MSTSTRNDQSGFGALRSPQKTAAPARAIATTSAIVTAGRLVMASPHEVVGVVPNTVSFMKLVKSFLAMWIHHSWGSLMKIQMNAASPMTARLVRRRGSHLVAMAT